MIIQKRYITKAFIFLSLIISSHAIALSKHDTNIGKLLIGNWQQVTTEKACDDIGCYKVVWSFSQDQKYVITTKVAYGKPETYYSTFSNMYGTWRVKNDKLYMQCENVIVTPDKNYPAQKCNNYEFNIVSINNNAIHANQILGPSRQIYVVFIRSDLF